MNSVLVLPVQERCLVELVMKKSLDTLDDEDEMRCHMWKKKMRCGE